jgi:thioredoxin-like negative regulator of GroEL
MPREGAMTISKFLIGLIAALFIQAGVFAWYNADLLYLRQPASVLAAGDPDAFAQYATEALARPRLTRRHLDTIAEVSAQFGQSLQEVEALQRRLERDPSDTTIKLRLADALRRSGQFDRAEQMYREVLGASTERRP